ncbi:hypothetical protein E6C60_0667 [Paenibacillus algicola]|uniref:Uncharacterized protein n=1 Tax=Paenibacillus algicola TaxID=2565926 RepID=A0A4P8XMB8_9BACL|nr:hypothetical protein [Paenibacillus algicola]QCT01389.1 hypothetical protein E6C60_0667 [Paenibacillus algicola]
MKVKEIVTDADLQNCIYFQQAIEVFIGGALDDVCYVIDYDAKIVKVREGFSYLRSNIKMFLNDGLCR